MAAPSCPECGGTRWVRYFSEKMDGNFEEAFKLCPCNHKSLSNNHPANNPDAAVQSSFPGSNGVFEQKGSGDLIHTE
jgi:hypothetical protein